MIVVWELVLGEEQCEHCGGGGSQDIFFAKAKPPTISGSAGGVDPFSNFCFSSRYLIETQNVTFRLGIHQ